MELAQQVIVLTLTPTLIVAGVTFVLKKFFEQSLARDIEGFKAKCTLELEQSKSLLQTQIFEFQTKFSSLHQKQTEVIGELYSLLNESEWAATDLIHPVQLGPQKPRQEKYHEAELSRAALTRFFYKHRIYLDPEVCERMDAFIRSLRQAIVKFDVSHMNLAGNPDHDMWLEAWTTIEKEIPPLKTAIETQFRQTLSSSRYLTEEQRASENK